MSNHEPEVTELRRRKRRSRSAANTNGDVEGIPHTTIDHLLLTERADQLQRTFTTHVQGLMDDVSAQIETLHQQIEKITRLHEVEESSSSASSAADDKNNCERRPNLHSLRKRFAKRSSLLSDLFQVRDIRTIRHVFIAVLIIFALQQLVHDIFKGDKSLFDLELIYWCFRKLSAVMVIWVEMQLSALALYIAYHTWSNTRSKMPSEAATRYFDTAALALYVCYLCGFILFPLKAMLRERPGLTSCTVALLEQTRMLMKQHAFVRENVPRALKGISCPDFSKYLYFLFAPTLIYRDRYPRTARIRWNLVVEYFAEFVVTVLFSYYVFFRVSAPNFNAVASHFENLESFTQAVYSCIVPGSLLLLLVFYGFFHCWLNAFAEMLTFADRLFYRDWWNCTSYRGFFRKWNMVVHDWLFNYVYLDCLMLFGPHRRLLCSFIVVCLSSIFHEYVFTFMFGYFYPVNLVLFGILGFFLSILPIPEESNTGNILFWVSFIIGLGLNVALCSMAWHARKMCGEEIGAVWNVILPKHIICVGWDPKDAV